MKFWASDYVFNYPWEEVCKAATRKYPNPMNAAVESIDVLDRRVKHGVLYTHRLIGSSWGVPGWLSAIMRFPTITHANERSEIDPKRKLMVLRTRNISLCKVIMIDETLWYRPCDKNPSKTHLRQEALVYVDALPLSSLVENYVVNTMAANAKKGRRAMEWMLKCLQRDHQKDVDVNAVVTVNEDKTKLTPPNEGEPDRQPRVKQKDEPQPKPEPEPEGKPKKRGKGEAP